MFMNLVILLIFGAFFLALPVRGQNGTVTEGNLNFTVGFVTPQVNLFFLDPGFMDASSAHGIVGASNNPAAFSFVEKGEVGTAVGLSRSTMLPFKINLIEPGDSSSTFPDGLSVPIDVEAIDRGGIEYFGVGYRVSESWVVGGSVIRGESIDLGMDISGKVSQKFTYTIDDTLTQADFPEIPPGDTIPVQWVIDMDGEVSASGTGEGDFSITPILLGAGTKWGPLRVGTGIRVTHYSGNLSSILSMGGEGSGGISVIDTLSNWTVSAGLQATIQGDSLFVDLFDGEISGTQFGIVFGTMGQLGPLEFGVALEHGFPFTLEGEFTNTFFYPSGLPQEINFDTTGVIIDTSLKEISGTLEIELKDFEREDRSTGDAGSFQFAPKTDFQIGAGLDLSVLRFGIGGGVEVAIGENATLGAFSLQGNTTLKIPRVPLRLGAVASWQFFDVGEFFLTTPPSVAVGVGTSIEFSKWTFDVATRANLLTRLLESLEGLEEEESFDAVSMLNFGVGARYRF
jgi:hypothetical protein